MAIFTNQELDDLVYAINQEGGSATTTQLEADAEAVNSLAAGSELNAWLHLLAAWVHTKR